MKKFFKTFGICALALPCALLFTACGSGPQETTVDISGKYEAVAQADALAYINDAKANDNYDFSGIKFTVTTDITAASQSAQAKAYGYMKVTADNQIEALMETYADGKMANAIYIVNNYLYMQAEGQKLKTPIMIETPGEIPDNVNVPSVDIVDSILTPDSVFTTCEKSTTNEVTKYHITVNTTALTSVNTDANVWLVFTNDILSGIQISYSYDYQGMSMAITMAMEEFNGEITFPSLDGYTEVTNPDLA